MQRNQLALYSSLTLNCTSSFCPYLFASQAVLLDDQGEEFCGGTILNKNFILTAAHCINQTKEIKVVVGE